MNENYMLEWMRQDWLRRAKQYIEDCDANNRHPETPAEARAYNLIDEIIEANDDVE